MNIEEYLNQKMDEIENAEEGSEAHALFRQLVSLNKLEANQENIYKTKATVYKLLIYIFPSPYIQGA